MIVCVYLLDNESRTSASGNWGGASRLKAGGAEVPISKPFLTIEEQPFLFWSLSTLAIAGIQKVVLAGNQPTQLQHAEKVIDSLPYDFQDVTFFQDRGLGAHGLPWHVRGLMDEQFIFECGHGINRPKHYKDMEAVKQPGKIVFSAFKSHPLNPRQPVMFREGKPFLANQGVLTGFALAHPFLIDQEYAERLPEVNNPGLPAMALERLHFVLSSIQA